MQSDEWMPIKDTGYEVSRDGKIRRAAPGENTYVGRIKMLGTTPNGYVHAALYKNGKAINVLVHRAVAEAFIGPIPKNMQVNHKDGNKLNNSVDNLEIVTCKENYDHALKNGLIKSDFYTMPRKRYYGEEHWTHKKPELLARGDNNGSRKHPEKLMRGVDQSTAKLNDDDIREIRGLFGLGVHKEIIAKLYGVTRTNIYYIVNYKVWRHVAWI